MMGYLFIAVGTGCIIIAIIGRKFTAADPISGAGFKDEKAMPRWAGKLLFGSIGIIFFIYGLTLLK
jgi:hypothetical protein